jgi:hypothetical protein
MNSDDSRLAAIEAALQPPAPTPAEPENIDIRIGFYDTKIAADGTRHTEAVPAIYEPLLPWKSIEPDESGCRIQVRFPRQADPTSAEQSVKSSVSIEGES